MSSLLLNLERRAKGMLCKDIMKKELHCVSPADSVEKAPD